MTFRHKAPRLALMLLAGAAAGCRQRETEPDNGIVRLEPEAPPIMGPADNAAGASVMRPAVVEEAEAAEPPAPPEPFAATVSFADGGTKLGEEAQAALKGAIEAAETLGGAITLRGHSDSKGNDEANKRMSMRRAEAVRDYLAEQGVAADRMKLVAVGEGRPIAPNATPEGADFEEGQRRNRRVEILIEPAAVEAADAPEVPGNAAEANSE